MLLERYASSNGWRWNVLDQDQGDRADRIEIGDWRAIILGAFPPALRGWLEGALHSGKEPDQFLPDTWEKFDSHCAIFLWKTNEDLVVVGGDPYAIAKVYTFNRDGRFLIGTRLPKLLRAVTDSPLPLDPGACAAYLLRGYTPARHTFYNDVQKMPPGTVMTVRDGVRSDVCYLAIDGPADLTGDEYVAAVQQAWEESIRRSLSAFDRHHLTLSGGIDSTFLLASFVKLGADPNRLAVLTGVSLGGPEGNVVLNPYDCDYAKRVAEQYKVKHEMIPMRWSDPEVLDNFCNTVSDLGSEASPGSMLFQRLGPRSFSSDLALYSAQNSDSVFSFTAVGQPRIVSRPPFVVGLGGWVSRYNLFGGPEGRTGISGILARKLLDMYLRRAYGARWADRTPVDRLIGLMFNSGKWPVSLTEQQVPYIQNPAALQDWFVEEYITKTGLLRLFEQNPHGAFLWLFLHNFMQGSDNRGTVWPSSLRQANSFLPFASLSILRLTARLNPDSRLHWVGKYPVMKLAYTRYDLPDYVLRRMDPATPELDRLFYTSFCANPRVYEYLESFFADAVAERFAGLLQPRTVERLITQFRARQFDQADVELMVRVSWLLTLERLAWG